MRILHLPMEGTAIYTVTVTLNDVLYSKTLVAIVIFVTRRTMQQRFIETCYPDLWLGKVTCSHWIQSQVHYVTMSTAPKGWVVGICLMDSFVLVKLCIRNMMSTVTNVYQQIMNMDIPIQTAIHVLAARDSEM